MCKVSKKWSNRGRIYIFLISKVTRGMFNSFDTYAQLNEPTDLLFTANIVVDPYHPCC
ncbi:hypothetical protein Hanom_Chr05g00467531 [Helianthus anomalus]